MNIVDLDLFALQVPGPSGAPAARSLLVRLGCENGAEGWGECPLPWRLADVEPQRQRVLGALSGRSVWDIQELALLDVLESAPLHSGVELAAWDLVGRALGQPVAHFWGGYYRSRVPLAVRLETSDPDEAARQARDLIDQPLRTIVVPLSGSPEADLALVRGLGEAVAGHAALRADAAGRYDPAGLASWLDRLPAGAGELLIDPFPADEWSAWATFREPRRLRLAAAAAIDSAAVVFSAARAGAISAAIIDPDRVGGPTAARQCGAVCAAADVAAGLAAGTSLGVGLAARLHLAAAAAPWKLGLETTYPALANDVLREPLPLVDGMLSVPTGPGWGIEIDRRKLERYQVA